MSNPSSLITAYVLTFNEARQIRDVLESLRWADEIIIVDSFSTDGTVAIAREYGAKIISQKFCGFGRLRNFALDAAKHDWIFSLDADERCTPEARDEILRIVADAASADAYLVPRRNILLGREIRHSGWFPDYRQPQLFRRGRMTYSASDEVHEGWELDGRLGRMRSPIVQIPYRTLSEAIAKMDRYTTLGVAKQERLGAQAGYAQAYFRASWAFFRAYVLQLGFLDGGPGLVIAVLRFENSFYKHAKLLEHRLPRRDGA